MRKFVQKIEKLSENKASVVEILLIINQLIDSIHHQNKRNDENNFLK